LRSLAYLLRMPQALMPKQTSKSDCPAARGSAIGYSAEKLRPKQHEIVA
jgi:hypothetical protein